ncbi:MAG: hypothetical protein U5L11_05270 [Arhodomonas sp.]|nr:hypothetical protein [Arhodomonas sp.]
MFVENYRVLDYEGNVPRGDRSGVGGERRHRPHRDLSAPLRATGLFRRPLGQVARHGSGFDAAGDLRERRLASYDATRILANPSSAFRYTRDADGHTVYVDTRLVPALDWHLIVEQDDAAAQGRIRRTLLVNLAIRPGVHRAGARPGLSTVRAATSGAWRPWPPRIGSPGRRTGRPSSSSSSSCAAAPAVGAARCRC